MNKDQILGLIRQVVTVIFTVLAAKWFQDGEATQGIIAAIVGAVATIWGLADKSLRGLSAWASAGRHLVSIAAGLIYVLMPGNETANSIIAAILAVFTALASTQANKAQGNNP